MPKIAIIGSGISGALAALQCSKLYAVDLYEAGSDVLPPSSTTSNMCYKVLIGMHYLGDVETAKSCLLHAIKFAKNYPELLARFENNENPLKGGHYYLLKHSLVSKEQARLVAGELVELYKKQIAEDQSNKVFGEPEQLITELARSSYNHISETIPIYNEKGEKTFTSVDVGFETAERQIDLEKARTELHNRLTSNPNISFFPNTGVTDIQHEPNQLGYRIFYTENKSNSIENRHYDAVINCAWEHIESINKKIGFYNQDPTAVNRIKITVRVKLPPALQHLQTSSFTTGPFYTITVNPNREAIITSERLTNFGFYKSGERPSLELQSILNELSSNEDKRNEFAKNIVKDFSYCLVDNDIRAQFLKSEIISLHKGYVKQSHMDSVYTNGSIFSKSSPIHKRRENGVVREAPCYFSFSATKATFAAEYAESVSEKLQKDFTLVATYNDFVSLLRTKLNNFLTDKHTNAVNSLIHFKFKERIIGVIAKDTTPEIIEEQANLISQELITYLDQSIKLNGNLDSFFKKGQETNQQQLLPNRSILKI